MVCEATGRNGRNTGAREGLVRKEVRVRTKHVIDSQGSSTSVGMAVVRGGRDSRVSLSSSLGVAAVEYNFGMDNGRPSPEDRSNSDLVCGYEDPKVVKDEHVLPLAGGVSRFVKVWDRHSSLGSSGVD